MDIEEPLGDLTIRHPDRRAVLIASGTGVAPFRSMLLSYLPESCWNATLLFGVRCPDAVLYRSEFERLEHAYPHFRFMPTVTRPLGAWLGRTGRVQAHLNDALNVQTPEELNAVDIYVCGMRNMVDDVRRLLKKRGIADGQIFYEKYD